MKKLYAILFVFLSISIISISNLKKDEIVGWYYYNGEDTGVIEFTEPEVFYIGKDSKGYYEIKYKNKLLKEKNNPNLRICKEDSRNHTPEEFRDLESSDIKNDEYVGHSCFYIPHFYYNYYVYKYTLGMTVALAIVKRILNGDTQQVERYLNFLKSGGKESPVDLLSHAGVDPLDDAIYDDAFHYFEDLLNEFEKLVK